MMDKSNVVYKVDGRAVSKSEAENAGYYSKYFYDDGSSEETKIEMLANGELVKIIYPNTEKPFDKVLNSHFTYTSVTAELWLPKQLLSDGGYSFLSYVYRTKSELYYASRCYFDKLDNLVNEIDIDIDSGEECGRTEYIYNESNELVQANKYDKFGNYLGKEEYG
jgi:hypothetical protein